MPGTDLAHGVPGKVDMKDRHKQLDLKLGQVRYLPTRLLCNVRYCCSLWRCRGCYGVPGTDIAYAATLSAYALAMRCPVLAKRMVLFAYAAAT
eukprot:616362-Rhodomonas_salina.3